MAIRRLALITCAAAVLGLAVATGDASPLTTTNFLTFSGDVGLPGVTLSRGNYVFEVYDLNHAIVPCAERGPFAGVLHRFHQAGCAARGHGRPPHGNVCRNRSRRASANPGLVSRGESVRARVHVSRREAVGGRRVGGSARRLGQPASTRSLVAPCPMGRSSRAAPGPDGHFEQLKA
jgi:hypothetical protein